MNHTTSTRLLVCIALAIVPIVATSSAIASPARARLSQLHVTHQPASVHRGALGGPSVIGQLHHIVTIGSTVDPMNGDQNPYGLMIAPASNGLMTQGDLLVCNFNDALNIQGLGTTIEVLQPTQGSNPVRFLQDQRITGCDALASGPDDAPWVAAFIANDNPFYDANANLLDNLQGTMLAQPWGQAFSGTKGPYGQAAFYESNATTGSIVRLGITKGGVTAKEIATGFPVNHGVPGTALAPSGLTYDPTDDTLYIVHGGVNKLYAFHSVSLIPPHGIVVGNNGKSFSGTAAGLAEIVYQGDPLAAPISASQLFNGNIVVGNTFNNILVEINPVKHTVVGMKNLDRGTIGALFGIAAAGTSAQTTQIFFNDDNANAVEVLQL